MPVIDVTKPEIIKFLNENYEKTAKLRIKWNIANKDRLKQAAQFSGEEKGYIEADVKKSILEAGMPALVRENIQAGNTRRKRPPEPRVLGIEDFRKGHSIVGMGLGDPKEDPRLTRPDDDFSFDPVMRPIPPKQLKMVYKGLPDYGRKEYLKTNSIQTQGKYKCLRIRTHDDAGFYRQMYCQLDYEDDLVRNRMKPEDKYYLQESKGWTCGWRLKDSYFGRHVPTYPRQGLLHRSLKTRTGPKPDPVHYKSPIELLTQNKCMF